MLNTFTIENYRLFRQFQIVRLGRVNLLVGKNNSGKSALLEALQIYASNASLITLREIMADREEMWNERSQTDLQRNGGMAVRHLFRGHRLPKIGERGILLGPCEDSLNQLHLHTGAYLIVTTDDDTLVRKLLSPSEAFDLKGEDEVQYSLIVQEGEKTRRLLPLDQPFDSIRSNRMLVSGEPRFPFQVVPTHNMPPKQIAAFWDIIGLTPLAEEVIAGLQLIDSSITGILFVESTIRNSARTPLVRSETASEPLPLKSMGDGMTRLFHIILALVSAKDGILLIDEFENGLHWSVQLAVWKTIFRLASRLNVQVFATTHSRDCVATFQGAWSDEPETGAFFRLQLDKDVCPRAHPYPLETLVDSLDTDVEVR